MASVFWIGLGVLAFGLLSGAWAGARSRDTGLLTGAAIGAFLGLVFGFPLLGVGLSTS
jgi:hypothetical protein